MLQQYGFNAPAALLAHYWCGRKSQRRMFVYMYMFMYMYMYMLLLLLLSMCGQE